VTADVSDPDDVAEMVETAATDLGDLDVLLNVAGVSTYEDSEDLDTRTWDLVQDVNLRGAFVAAREAFPHLRGGGRVVNVSSIAGLYGAASMSHYGAAKAGVRNLTQSLAAEWADDNVRVNAVAPGPILTPGVRDFSRRPTRTPTSARRSTGPWARPPKSPTRYCFSPARCPFSSPARPSASAARRPPRRTSR